MSFHDFLSWLEGFYQLRNDPEMLLNKGQVSIIYNHFQLAKKMALDSLPEQLAIENLLTDALQSWDLTKAEKTTKTLARLVSQIPA